MSPDQPLDPREELEIKITALVMGQLSPEEAVALEAKIAADPQLAALQARLRHAANLLKEARALPEAHAPAAPLQLSKERREKLLAAFRGIKPLPSPTVQTSPPPSSLQPARQKRKWTQPVILAASIAVLLTGVAALLMPAMSGARKGPAHAGGMSDPKNATNDWYYRGAVAEPAAEAQLLEAPHRASGMSDPKALALLPATPPQVKLAINAPSRSNDWAYRPGSAPSSGSGRVERELGRRAGREVASDSVQTVMGSGQGVPRVEGFSVPQGRMAGEQAEPADVAAGSRIYLPKSEAEIAQNPTPYALAFSPQPNDVKFRQGAGADGSKKTDEAQTGAANRWEKQAGAIRSFSDLPTHASEGEKLLAGQALFSEQGQRDGDKPAGSAEGKPADGTSKDARGFVLHEDASGPAAQSARGKKAIEGAPASEFYGLLTEGMAGLDAGALAAAKDQLAPNEPQEGRLAAADAKSSGESANFWIVPDSRQPLGDSPATGIKSNQLVTELSASSLHDRALNRIETQSEGIDWDTQFGSRAPGPKAKQPDPNSLKAGVAAHDAGDAERAKEITEQIAAGGAGLADGTAASAGGLGPKLGGFKAPRLNPADDQLSAVPKGTVETHRVEALSTDAFVIDGLKDVSELREELRKLPAAEQKLREGDPVKPDYHAPVPSTATATEPAPAKAKEPPPVPQPEVFTKENAFSTFSLNVSDVSFQLAAASLDKGQMPEPASIRSEEFINAFDYRDPQPAQGAPLAFASERARYPFAHNRDLLRLSVKTAAAGREAGRPLNLVLLLDNSGSMERADRVRILQESLRVLTKQLQPQDKLSIITFSRTPRLWVDGVAGDKAPEYTQRVGEITPQGGTDLSAAMDLGYQTALKHYQAGSINRVVLLTDGAANLGEVKPETLKEQVETHRKQGVAFDCFGVGWEGYNDDLLEQLSRNGDGRYGFINTPEAAATEFAGQLAGALRVAASDVKVQVEFNPKRVSAYRQIGYAKHQLKKEQFRDNTVDAAEIGAAESGNALYAIEVNPRGEGDIATVRARFKTPGTAEYHEHEWTVPYGAPALAMEQGSSSLRLAAAASAFSEWLAQSPFASEVTTDRLLALMRGVPAIYGADPRPAKLEAMIRQAKSISGR